MKATLEFKLPEERTEFDQARHGADWYLVVEHLSSVLRNIRKHRDLRPSEITLIEELERILYESVDDRGLHL